MSRSQDRDLAALASLAASIPAIAGSGLFVCDGRGTHDITAAVLDETSQPPADRIAEQKLRTPTHLGWACPECGRRVRFGSHRMSQIARALREGKITRVNISFC